MTNDETGGMTLLEVVACLAIIGAVFVWAISSGGFRRGVVDVDATAMDVVRLAGKGREAARSTGSAVRLWVPFVDEGAAFSISTVVRVLRADPGTPSGWRVWQEISFPRGAFPVPPAADSQRWPVRSSHASGDVMPAPGDGEDGDEPEPGFFLTFLPTGRLGGSAVAVRRVVIGFAGPDARSWRAVEFNHYGICWPGAGGVEEM